jgi:hypothetical protein
MNGPGTVTRRTVNVLPGSARFLALVLVLVVVGMAFYVLMLFELARGNVYIIAGSVERPPPRRPEGSFDNLLRNYEDDSGFLLGWRKKFRGRTFACPS